jgi:hypothetical protein
MVNILERRYRWGRTRAYTLGFDNIVGELSGYVIVGSERWFRSPQMLSLYILILRSAVNHNKFRSIDGRTTYNTLMKILGKDAPRIPDYGDARWLWKVVPFFPVLMGQHAKLFRGLKREANFVQIFEVKNEEGHSYFDSWSDSDTREAISIGEEGIDTFVSGESDYQLLTKRFKRLVKESVKRGEIKANDARVKRLVAV